MRNLFRPTGVNSVYSGRVMKEVTAQSTSEEIPTPTDLSDLWAIPDSWKWLEMADVATIVGGGTPKTFDPENFDGGEISWITPADLSAYTEKYIARGARNITEQGLKGSSARLLPINTVLFSSRAPIGYVAIASQPVTTNQGFKSFVLPKSIDPSFVYYYLKCAKEEIETLGGGTTFKEISGAVAAKIPLVLAPLAEQGRIVAEIETQFTRLDASVAALRRAQANLKRYRASVPQGSLRGPPGPHRGGAGPLRGPRVRVRRRPAGPHPGRAPSPLGVAGEAAGQVPGSLRPGRLRLTGIARRLGAGHG